MTLHHLHRHHLHHPLQRRKKKDLAFKASQEKGKARLEYESSSDDEIDAASLALMVRRTAKMLKKLNKSGIKFDGKKKKFFTSSRRKPISERIATIVENLVI